MSVAPLISVVIPAYNYGRYLPKALSSVQAQDFQDWELVVVDDCSTDDTPERLQPFQTDARIRVIRNPENLGAVANVNKAFGEAQGEFVLLLGADDFLMPGCLGRLHNALRQYPQAGFAYANYVMVDDQDRLVATVRHPGHLPCYLPPGRDDFPDLLRFDEYIYMGATLFRSQVIREHGAFDPALTVDDQPGRFFRATDWDMALRLSLRGVPSTFVYAPLGAFRIHDNQASIGRDFDEQGIGAREFAVLLDRYLVPENRARLAGYEAGILDTLNRKREAYRHASLPGRNGDPARVLAAYERGETYLRELQNDPLDGHLENPTLTIVLPLMDTPETVDQVLAKLDLQQFPNWELVVVNRGRMDCANLGDDPTRSQAVRYLHLPGVGLATAYNLAAQVAAGQLLYFMDPQGDLAPDFLAYLVQALSQPGCTTVQYPVATREPKECAGLHPAWSSLLRMVLPVGHPWQGQIPPLAAFALRRALFLRQGGLDQSLPLLADLDFILTLERNFTVHQLASQGTALVGSMIAMMFQENALGLTDRGIEHALQMVVRKFALPFTQR